MTTATADTLVVSRATIVDLLATLQAAASLIGLEDDEPSPEHLRDVVYGAEEKFRLVLELLGAVSSDELEARSSEIEADLIEEAWNDALRGQEAHGHYECKWGRPAQLRVLAERIREEGSDEARFPSRTELAAMRAAEDA
jgi:hypothetical protein